MDSFRGIVGSRNFLFLLSLQMGLRPSSYFVSANKIGPKAEETAPIALRQKYHKSSRSPRSLKHTSHNVLILRLHLSARRLRTWPCISEASILVHAWCCIWAPLHPMTSCPCRCSAVGVGTKSSIAKARTTKKRRSTKQTTNNNVVWWWRQKRYDEYIVVQY